MAVKEIIRNKKYKIDVPIGYNGTKRIRHCETFYGGKKEAVLRENEIKMSVRNNTYVRRNTLTIKDLNEEWLEFKKNKIVLKTYKTYSKYSKNIVNSIGHIKLKDVNVKILENFYNELKTETTFAEATIKYHYNIISSMLNYAVKWGYLNNNPNNNVEPIKVHKKDMKCYSPEEIEKLLSALSQEPIKYQALILLTLDSGCRRGEITGLLWDDVNFEEGTIHINKTTQYVPGYGTFEKETKSDTSDRNLYITPTTLAILKRYKSYQDERKLLLGPKWQNSKRVFTTEYGADMHPDTPSKIFSKIIKKHNLEYMNFHGLRHTSISLQICIGIQSQIISKRAGHSGISITHKMYSHFFDSEFKDVANKMDNFLNNTAI